MEATDNQKALIEQLQPMGRHFPSATVAGVDKEPIRVAISGAAGQIGTFLCHFIAQGRMFGPYQKVILHLIELPFAEKYLNGLIMELNDSAYKNLAGIVGTMEDAVGFKDVDVALLVGAKPRGPGMERKDLLEANAKIFEAQGKAIDEHAKKTIKVLVVGNPCNTNALITSTFAPSIPKKNITAMTRLDQCRALSQISEKSGVPIEKIKDVIIWGNHSATQYPDIHHATVNGKPAKDLYADDETYNAFIKKVAQRGKEIIDVMGKSSAASAAASICEHMHDWWFGNQMGGIVSMGVIKEGGAYGVDGDLCFSYPCNVKDGEWQIVEGLEINEFSQAKIKATEAELLEERQMALKR